MAGFFLSGQFIYNSCQTFRRRIRGQIWGFFEMNCCAVVVTFKLQENIHEGFFFLFFSRNTVCVTIEVYI